MCCCNFLSWWLGYALIDLNRVFFMAFFWPVGWRPQVSTLCTSARPPGMTVVRLTFSNFPEPWVLVLIDVVCFKLLEVQLLIGQACETLTALLNALMLLAAGGFVNNQRGLWFTEPDYFPAHWYCLVSASLLWRLCLRLVIFLKSYLITSCG